MADKQRWLEVLESFGKEKVFSESVQKELEKTIPTSLEELFKNRSYVPAKGTSAKDGKPTVEQAFAEMAKQAKTKASAQAFSIVFAEGFAHYRTIHKAQRAETTANSLAIRAEQAKAAQAKTTGKERG